MTFKEILGEIKGHNIGAIRKAWKAKKRFLSWDERNKIININDNEKSGIWYWDDPDDFETAAADLHAADWELIPI